MANPVKDPLTGAETTGHVWDENLQEFNNPLPRWWLWMFYASFVFAITYWLIYPAWPIADSYTKGFGTVSYKNANGEEVTTHWNTRALLAQEMQTDADVLKQKDYLAKIAAAPYEQIAQDAEMSAFVMSYAKGVFGTNCAACHQTGAQGVVGLFPNLVDDDWLWGGDAKQIETTIRQGRLGFMPAFRNTFNEEQLDQVANYVLSLSGLSGYDTKAAEQGKLIFNGESGACYYCHTTAGTGMYSQGSANLTDKIWTIANIPTAETNEARLKAIKSVISNGVQRQMPTFGGRLDDTEIKVLVAYLRQMSVTQ